MNAKEQTVKIALKKLFNQNSFSICTVDELLKITNTIPDKATYQLLHAMHCVNYSDMTKEYRDWLFKTTMGLFISDGFPLEIIDRLMLNEGGRIIDITPQAQESERTGFFKRLLK